MTEIKSKHAKNLPLYKGGDNFYVNGQLSTGEGDFQKLFIFQGQSESTVAHSIQT